MKKLLIVTAILFTLCFQSRAFAGEPYIGTQFPPEEILKKIIPEKMGDKGEYLGKIELKDSTYLVYYQFPKGRVESIGLIRLDTNYWVYDGKKILMK